MVTPFDARGGVDEAAATALMKYLVANGSDGLVMAGTTGEASTLTDDEKLRLYALAVQEVGDTATVIAGTGSNDTAHSVHLTEEAAKLGVDAVLAVTPYYNKPPREGLVGHFRAIAKVGVPVVVYNIPSRAVINMPPDLIAELGRIPNIVAVKQAHDDPAQSSAVREMAPDMALYAGNDDLLLPVMKMGGAGVISVASHLVASRMQELCDAVEAGRADDAQAIDDSLQDLFQGLFVTSSPILIKAALEILGRIPSGRMRLPLVEATPVQRDILQTVLAGQGLLGVAA
jgi:4-hydroxy-tetrahydrodipicolinate synthase